MAERAGPQAVQPAHCVPAPVLGPLGLRPTGESAHPAPAHLVVSPGLHPLSPAGNQAVGAVAVVGEAGPQSCLCRRPQHYGGCCQHRVWCWLAAADYSSWSAPAQAGGVCYCTRQGCWHAGVHADPVRHCSTLCTVPHGILHTATCACGAVCCGRIAYRMIWGHLGSSQNAARIGT